MCDGASRVRWRRSRATAVDRVRQHGTCATPRTCANGTDRVRSTGRALQHGPCATARDWRCHTDRVRQHRTRAAARTCAAAPDVRCSTGRAGLHRTWTATPPGHAATRPVRRAVHAHPEPSHHRAGRTPGARLPSASCGSLRRARQQGRTASLSIHDPEKRLLNDARLPTGEGCIDRLDRRIRAHSPRHRRGECSLGPRRQCQPHRITAIPHASRSMSPQVRLRASCGLTGAHTHPTTSCPALFHVKRDKPARRRTDAHFRSGHTDRHAPPPALSSTPTVSGAALLSSGRRPHRRRALPHAHGVDVSVPRETSSAEGAIVRNRALPMARPTSNAPRSGGVSLLRYVPSTGDCQPRRRSPPNWLSQRRARRSELRSWTRRVDHCVDRASVGLDILLAVGTPRVTTG